MALIFFVFSSWIINAFLKHVYISTTKYIRRNKDIAVAVPVVVFVVVDVLWSICIVWVHVYVRQHV